ncbi:MAG TPA: hypothetical protein VN721_12700 [Flavipsychrobacter sp.]|nr:hypothetical protein [Flavipsychrobacter sp.]
MSLKLQRYTEPLDAEEIAFLRKKEQKERKQYYRVYSMLMVLSFIIPFAGAWYRALDGVENAFSPLRFFMGTGVLLSISTLGTWFAYNINLKKVQSDIRNGTKTIELTHITRKQYMPQNNTYYFYLNSPNKLSIEVSQSDFYSLSEGDELTIEYTTFSKLYLGYF